MAGEFVITDGTVEYKHSKPLAEYDNKAPMVRLTFTVAEGSDPLAVTEKVMGMAMEVVERAIATNVTVLHDAKALAKCVDYAKANDIPVYTDEAHAPPPKPRGRPPTVAPTSDVAPVGKSQNPASDAAAITDDEPEPAPVPEPEEKKKKLTYKDDLQPISQKVSAKLRKQFGNINDLRDLIKELGGTNLLTIPEDKWPTFMTRADAMLKEEAI